MNTLQNWLLEARGMPEEVKANAMKISQMLLKIEGKKLGIDGVSRLKGFIEEAREAYEAIIASSQSFGSLSSKELANISWEPFADAVWTAVLTDLDSPAKAEKSISKFNAVAKWLLPLLLPK